MATPLWACSKAGVGPASSRSICRILGWPPSTRQDKKAAGGAPALVAFVTGCVLSVSVGFCDLVLGMLGSKPEAFASFSGMLPPLAVTTLACFAVYMVSWLLATLFLGRIFGCKAAPLALSLAAFWALLFVITTVSDLTEVAPDTREQWVEAKVTVSFLLSLFFAVACYRLVPAAGDPLKHGRIFRLAGPLVMSLLALLVAYVWLQTYRPATGAGSVMLLGGFVLGVLLVLWTVVRVGPRIHPASFPAALVVLIVLGPLALWAPPKKAGASLEKLEHPDHSIRHVILLTVDALRPDFLSCYEKRAVPTPNIDRIARDASVFTRAVSPAPWTLPSFASIMTGVCPSVHRASGSCPKVPESLHTLAEHMRDAGYFTGAIGLNSWLVPKSNMSQGFHDYNFFPPPSFGSTFGGKLLQILLPSRFNRQPSSGDLTRKACRWLEENAEKDFFFWLHYLDPHCPYAPPEHYLPDRQPPPRVGKAFHDTIDARGGRFIASADEREWIKDLYEAEVRYVDDCVGTLLDTIRRLEIYDEALIVFLSDHGEEFWEHGGVDHGHTLYDEVIRVPLMIKLPRSRSTAKRSAELVCTAGVMPTILDLCEVDYHAEYLSYRSLSPLLGPDPQAFETAPIVTSGTLFFDDQEAVLAGGMKYVRSLITGREQLYDLQADPQERVSIAASAAGKLAQARAIAEKLNRSAQELRNHFGELGTDAGAAEPSEEMLRDLRSLGYVR